MPRSHTAPPPRPRRRALSAAAHFAESVGRAHLLLATQAGLDPADDAADQALRWTTLRLLAAQLATPAELEDFDAARDLAIPHAVRDLTRLPPGAAPGQLIGAAHQYLLDRRLRHGPDGALDWQPLRGSQRKTSGSFYTPPELVAACLGSLRAVAAETPRPLLLDPAMGVGHFLVAAVCELAGDDPEARAAVLSRCIHGVDLDPQAVALARVVLASLCPAVRPADLRPRLLIGDALLGADLHSALDPAAADAWTAARLGVPLDSFRPLHWRHAFPAAAAQGGFDVIIGNPPWERLEPEAREFFAGRHAAVNARHTTAARQATIAALADRTPALHADWSRRQERQAALKRFYRDSGRFPLGARGRMNTYALFADLARQAVHPSGRWQLILPSGIVMDQPLRDFWRALADSGQLIRCAEFENAEGIFADVHREQRFCLLEAGGAASRRPHARFSFALRAVSDLADPSRQSECSPADFAAISPNSRQPIPFRSVADMLLLRHIYRRCEPLYDEAARRGQARGWVAMTSAAWSRHCHSRPAPGRLPLYEAKLMHQYDPAHASFRPPVSRGDLPLPRDPATAPAGIPTPRLWMDAAQVRDFLQQKAPGRDWLLAYRDVTNVNNARTCIAAVLPAAGLLQPLNGIHTADAASACRVLAVLNSFACDYVARQRITGRHLNVGTLHDLPLPPPTLPWPLDPLPLVRELSHSLHELDSFARELGHHGPPAPWDPARRQDLRCRLDAAVLHLYLGPASGWCDHDLCVAFPTPRHAAAHILASFTLATKRHPAVPSQILAHYDAMGRD